MTFVSAKWHPHALISPEWSPLTSDKGLYETRGLGEHEMCRKEPLQGARGGLCVCVCFGVVVSFRCGGERLRWCLGGGGSVSGHPEKFR